MFYFVQSSSDIRVKFHMVSRYLEKSNMFFSFFLSKISPQSIFGSYRVEENVKFSIKVSGKIGCYASKSVPRTTD